jgi:hypothetical protein
MQVKLLFDLPSGPGAGVFTGGFWQPLTARSLPAVGVLAKREPAGGNRGAMAYPGQIGRGEGKPAL